MKRLIIIALAAIMALCVPSVSSAQIKRKAYQQQTERTTLQNNKNNKQTVIQDRSDAFYIIEEPKPPVVKEKKKIEVKYQGEVNAGVAYGVTELDDLGMFSLSVNTVHGILVSKYFFAGLGAGLDYNFELGLDVPIFANFKGLLPVKNDLCSVYISTSGGYQVGGLIGPFVKVGFGVNYKYLNFDLGFMYSDGYKGEYDEYYTGVFNLYLGVGYKF